MNLHALISFGSRKTAATEPGIPRASRRTLTLCREVLSEQGEFSGLRLARECLDAWLSLEGEELAAFLDLLSAEFSPDPEKAAIAAQSYREDASPANLAQLIATVEPLRLSLFTRLNAAPDGTKSLVAIRKRLLPQLGAHPAWTPIEADLEHLLRSWFNRGFLTLQRIDWSTPASVLEKLIQYEAVHEIQGWRDLRRRLEADRRCYAFFHQALGDDPIIFVEVALTHGLEGRVQPLLDADAPVLEKGSANCAIFYSITNCQEGLRGIPFGDFLIKQVAEYLGRELPQIRTFATLSPVPSFRVWLNSAAKKETGSRAEMLAAVLEKLNQPDWTENSETAEWLKSELEPLCAHFLLRVRHGREPLDPVARFHLRNGARLERLNWLGDTSATGLHRSAGLMVNYVYRLGEVERNHEEYMKEHRIAAAGRIASLARKSITERDLVDANRPRLRLLGR